MCECSVDFEAEKQFEFYIPGAPPQPMQIGMRPKLTHWTKGIFPMSQVFCIVLFTDFILNKRLKMTITIIAVTHGKYL